VGDKFAEMGGEKDDVVAIGNMAGDVVDDTKENQAAVDAIEEKKDGKADKKSSEFPPISYFSLYRWVSAVLCCITIMPTGMDAWSLSAFAITSELVIIES
jgi:hypothetical protein